ncbi:MAG: RNA polymerase sigma factor [bacterium]|nr:RNA polymerase sigma factor [bacterium]
MATALTIMAQPARPVAEAPPEELILAARDGHRPSLEELLTSIERRVYALAYRLTGNRAAAEDLSQEALLKVCRHIGRYRTGSSFWGWVYRIVVNQARDNYRKAKPEVGEPSELAVEPDVDPVRGEQLRLVMRAMSCLTGRERAALVLIDIEGYSGREAAAVLGCLAITARTRAAQARKKVRRVLSRHYPELREDR